jgi:hypothetical protein
VYKLLHGSSVHPGDIVSFEGGGEGMVIKLSVDNVTVGILHEPTQHKQVLKAYRTPGEPKVFIIHNSCSANRLSVFGMQIESWKFPLVKHCRYLALSL